MAAVRRPCRRSLAGGNGTHMQGCGFLIHLLMLALYGLPVLRVASGKTPPKAKSCTCQGCGARGSHSGWSPALLSHLECCKQCQSLLGWSREYPQLFLLAGTVFRVVELRLSFMANLSSPLMHN